MSGPETQGTRSPQLADVRRGSSETGAAGGSCQPESSRQLQQAAKAKAAGEDAHVPLRRNQAIPEKRLAARAQPYRALVQAGPRGARLAAGLPVTWLQSPIKESRLGSPWLEIQQRAQLGRMMLD